MGAARRMHGAATMRLRRCAQSTSRRSTSNAWVIALGAGHHDRLRRQCPPQQAHKLRRAADFSARIPAGGVPDPYYGDAGEFEAVLDQIEAVCEGVLAEVGRLGE